MNSTLVAATHGRGLFKTTTLARLTISGKAGVGGATLSYKDVTPKTVTADASGNYSLAVSYGWSGTLTPSKPGFSFSPGGKAYSQVITNLGAQNYSALPLKSVSYGSIGTQDGWALESSESSLKGGTINGGATIFNVGDDAADKQYRAILSFNTAALPDTAVIQSAVLKIQQSGVPVGANPFSALGGLLVDIRKPFFGTSSSLQLGDFNVAPSASKVGTFNKTPSGGWYSVTLNATGRNNINKTNLTQFRLYFSLDDNNNHLANLMRFFSGNAPAASRPQLIITYTVP
jgi:hypothetical protein